MPRLLGWLAQLDPLERRMAVIVVDTGDTFHTFTYADLVDEFQRRGDDSLLGASLLDLLPQVGAVETPTADIAGEGFDAPRYVQRTAPRQRVVIVDAGEPTGVLADVRMGRGVHTDIPGIESFAPREAASPPPAEPDEEADRADADEAVDRWLSVAIEAAGERRTKSFQAGERHVISVGIAPADPALIQSDQAFPDAELASGETHELDVVLWGSGVADEPLSGKLLLPPSGASPKPCRFTVLIPAAAHTVELAIAVLYRCRVLESATLRGVVTDGPDALAPDGATIELRRSPAAGGDLASMRPFAATIITNRDEVLIEVCGGSRRLILSGLDAAKETIQRRLFDAAAGQARDEGGLDSEALLSLLRVLAYHGHAIYQELVRGDTAALADAGTIEVVSRSPVDFLPIELVYDRGAPRRDAELCPGFAQATATECPDCRAHGDGSGYVCPLGFWGLTKEIGRRISAEVEPDELRRLPGPTPGVPTLPKLGGVLVAASDRVDLGGSPEVEATVATAAELFPDAHFEAHTWPDWVEVVERNAPGLLLAMPHTDHDRDFDVDVLQIGADSNLSPLEVSRDYVGSHEGSGPLLLLLGCTTATPEIGYLGFVPKFAASNAAIVVGTIAKILGRYTGPVARALLRQFVAAQGSDAPISEIMRRVRLDSLREGNTVGLTLVAYGDADWKLGPV